MWGKPTMHLPKKCWCQELILAKKVLYCACCNTHVSRVHVCDIAPRQQSYLHRCWKWRAVCSIMSVWLLQRLNLRLLVHTTQVMHIGYCILPINHRDGNYGVIENLDLILLTNSKFFCTPGICSQVAWYQIVVHFPDLNQFCYSLQNLNSFFYKQIGWNARTSKGTSQNSSG